MNKLGLKEYIDEYCKDIQHANQVNMLSLKLFDETNEKLKKMSNRKRELLEAAALLHDIGYYIESKKHNKHSQNIILEKGIEGFDEDEIKKIANIARYHRGKNPDSKKHKLYAILDKKGRKTVKKLAGILRIADGLDCGHKNHIKNLTTEYDEKQNILTIILTPDTKGFRPDLMSAIIKKDLFEKAFKTQVIIKLQ